MKKNIFLSIFCICILFTTGCGNEKRLTCTQKSNEDSVTGLTNEEESVLVFNGNKLNKINVKLTTTFNEESKEAMDYYYKAMEESVNGMKSTKGIESSIDKKNNKIVTSLEVDVKKYNKKDTTINVDIDDKYTIDDYKKQHEDQGYTCKMN